MPPQTVSRLEHLRTLRYANLDGAFAAAFITLVSGAFVVNYAKHLGASDLWIGVFTAIPSFIGLLQIPGAIWGRSYPTFKKFVSPGGLIWRLFHLPLAIVPFLVATTDLKLAIMLASVALAAIAVQIVGPIYNDWLAEMIPPNSRGWFFSRRNRIGAVMGALAALAGGLLTDYFKRTQQIDVGFSVTCMVGIGLSLISMFFYYKMSDIPRTNPLKVSLASGLKAMNAPFVDRDFRKVLFFFTFYIIAQSFAGNFFSAFAFETIGMSMTLLQLTAVCHAVGNVLASRFFGFLADKYGNKPLLTLLTVGIALTPFQWVLLRPGQDLYNALILGPGHIFTGMCWSGIAIAQYNLLLATAKEEDRANYIGAGLALQAVMGAVGPMLGAVVMNALRPSLGAEQAYHMIFYITMGLRVASLLLLAPVREVGAASLRGALKEMVKVSPAGFRALKSITQAGDAQTRVEAIATAGDTGMEMARDEVIRALHDPSPRVRRQAAASLGRLGGEASVEALLHMVQDHPDLVDDEMLETLGELGDRRAVEHLVAMLDSPRPSIRRAAARALGDIGGEQAVKALREVATRRDDPDVRRASLQGLRRLSAVEAQREISEACLDPLPSVRIAAAEAVAELEVREAAAYLRAALDRFSDEACSEIAYALGCVGDFGDLPAILKEARRSNSVITRRRCLLGMARLMGVESELYRIFLHEAISKDAELLAQLGPAMRKSAEFRAAVELFATDREQEALGRLGKFYPELGPMLAIPVRESFLVAAYWAAVRIMDDPNSQSKSMTNPS